MDSSTRMLILVAILAVIWLATVIFKRLRYRRLEYLIAQEDLGPFLKLVDALSTRLLFPEYNLTYMKLNGYLMHSDDEHAAELFDKLLARKLNKRQRTDLVLKAFNFFVGINNKQRAKELLTEIDAYDEAFERAQLECHQMYDVIISKKSNHITEMEEELKRAGRMRRGQLAFLLALQYDYRGDRKRSEAYLSQAKDDYGVSGTAEPRRAEDGDSAR